MHKFFAFIGFHNEKPDPNLDVLMEKLNAATKPFLDFSRKDALLMARFDEVFFYASISNNRKELDDWIQMATDHELSIDLTELTQDKLSKRYENLKKLSSNEYDDLHFGLAEAIFREMSQFSNLSIYSFQ